MVYSKSYNFVAQEVLYLARKREIVTAGPTDILADFIPTANRGDEFFIPGSFGGMQLSSRPEDNSLLMVRVGRADDSSDRKVVRAHLLLETQRSSVDCELFEVPANRSLRIGWTADGAFVSDYMRVAESPDSTATNFTTISPESSPLPVVHAHHSEAYGFLGQLKDGRSVWATQLLKSGNGTSCFQVLDRGLHFSGLLGIPECDLGGSSIVGDNVVFKPSPTQICFWNLAEYAKCEGMGYFEMVRRAEVVQNSSHLCCADGLYWLSPRGIGQHGNYSHIGSDGTITPDTGIPSRVQIVAIRKEGALLASVSSENTRRQLGFAARGDGNKFEPGEPICDVFADSLYASRNGVWRLDRGQLSFMKI